MAGWEDKDDLDLTAQDIAEMLAGGTPVEVDTPSSTVITLSWVGENVGGFRVPPATFGSSSATLGGPARSVTVRAVVHAGPGGPVAADR